MKTKLLFLAVLSTITSYSQIQIGDDIVGEALEDFSGYSISISSEGSIVAIGAYNNWGSGYGSGHVRVYQNSSGDWTQIGADIDGETAGDWSGTSVSLSSNGSTLAIGAVNNDENGSDSGHVRVYKNMSGVWTQIGADIDGGAAYDWSGKSVSLSSDGNTVAIGAYGDKFGVDPGHVSVYKNISDVWIQIGGYIYGEVAFDWSGYSVSLSSDGSILAIGAPANDGNDNGSGHVRVYQNLSDVWTQIGDDIDGEAAHDGSGLSVSMSSDGSMVAIGAPSNDGNGDGSGHVRVYQNLSGVWTQIGADIDGEAVNDFSGWSVSLSSDGSIVAIGAKLNDGNGGNGSASGHVRIYKNILGVWTQLGTDINGETENDLFGHSVSLSSDGSVVAIGAPADFGIPGNSGYARVYDLSSVLSLEDNIISKNFIVYPNPVNDQLQLQVATNFEFKKAAIYNYSGQLVFQSNNTKINVSDLASGVYFIEVETNNGKGVKKIIKK